MAFNHRAYRIGAGRFLKENKDKPKGSKGGRGSSSGAKPSTGGSSKRQRADLSNTIDIEEVMMDLQPSLSRHIQETKDTQQQMLSKLDAIVETLKSLPNTLCDGIAAALLAFSNKQQ